MRPRLGCAEQLYAAFPAEAPVHHVAAVRDADVIAWRARISTALLGKHTLTVALPPAMRWHTLHQQTRVVMGAVSIS